ncbi:MAG: sn-glycerol-3-phosphate ABC transporter ATP-binding protein UgpC [Deltaproteobacteria bacterium]|nr:sn-glycerol-3-phosphate ABC transporter ATP-binding protein UgpC [Deltaproteobacteria bacterium]MBW2139929.1 sn-glycerol-3-phosphate ABC transporter ATP-binding protein UgpC [Deltaproteobacteria bacterium]
MAKVRLKDVTKTFGRVLAVKDFTLDIRDGEFIIMVGPSGCGKTTTLRAIAGLETITSGDIFIGDQSVINVAPKDRDVAMVFQNYALYPHMNVYRNMAFCLKLRKLPKQEIDRIVKRTADLLGIGELLERKPNELSGGQRQRVALGRAIVRDPEVFLFDEPLSNLDAKLRITMRAELLDLHQRLETTAIYVTHDQMEAMTMGDRIVVMNEGLIQQVDTPQNVYDHPVNKYVAGFIGSPSMNFIEGVVMKKNGDLYIRNEDLNLKIPDDKARLVEKYHDKEVVLGLRPEHIADAQSFKESDLETGFKASVWVVEPLGSEQLVHIKLEHGDSFIARLDPQLELKTGETVEFAARMNLAHLFDKETEDIIF